jgi:hypothetical protein
MYGISLMRTFPVRFRTFAIWGSHQEQARVVFAALTAA